MTDTPNSSNRLLDGRTALITGASRGIGAAIAKALAAKGAHILALGRVKGALEELYDGIKADNGTCTLINIDLENGDDIDAIGPSLAQRWDKLDILVANAGILGPLTPLPHVSVDDWDKVMRINLTSNWRLIRTLDPLLQQSDAARVIFVSSGASSGKYAYWGPYAVSKAGLEALAHTYANEVADSNIRVNIVNPGKTQTGMRAQAFPGENPDTLKTPDEIAPLFVELASPSCTKHDELIDAATWLAGQSTA